MEILTNRRLELDNVIAYRNIFAQNEASDLLFVIEEFIKRKELVKCSEYINVTHGVKQKEGQVYLDLEILVAVDKKVKTTNGIRYIEHFKLNDAIVCKYEGSPLGLKGCGELLEQYIVDNKLKSITPGYLVTKEKTNRGKNSLSRMSFEIYIGLETNFRNEL